MEVINQIYESISIYRSIIICSCVHECDLIAELLLNNDYSISLNNFDRTKRILILEEKDLIFEQEPNDNDFNVVFISKLLRETINLNHILDKFVNVAMVAFIDL